MSTKKIDLP